MEPVTKQLDRLASKVGACDCHDDHRCTYHAVMNYGREVAIKAAKECGVSPDDLAFILGEEPKP